MAIGEFWELLSVVMVFFAWWWWGRWIQPALCLFLQVT
jgi:hypothetical protein